MPYCWGYQGAAGYGEWIGAVIMIVWWLIIVAAIILLVRWVAGQSRGSSTRRGEKTAEDILKERYARGDINKEEFEKMKKDLS
ncbi:MAG: SHOCT domain-containing protein [bacterium]|nr:SHOCT domain-containing protein [bacterium]